MKNFITRALTGIVFVAILVSAIYFHSYYFLGVFSLITGLTLWELYGLVLPEASPFNRFMGTIGGAYLFAATFGYTEKGMGAWIFLPYLLILIYLMVVALYEKGKNPLTHWSMLLFGQAYCAGSFSLLNGLAYKSELIEGLAPMPIFILALFVLIWLNDTGAYLIGSMLGKHRLFARISPKKSWEGFFGGLAVAVLGSQLLATLDPLYSHLQWMGLAIVVVAFGTWGDLIESLLKRTIGVKDSGNLLPGHGGMLDRFDSLLLAAPASYIYIELFIQN